MRPRSRFCWNTTQSIGSCLLIVQRPTPAKWMHDARTAEKYPAPPPLVVSWSPFGSMKLTTAWRTWVSTAYRVARTCESAANAGELGNLESVLASVGGDIEGPENIMAKALKVME